MIKAMGWQVLGLLVSFAVSLVFTGSLFESSALSLTLACVGLLTYVLYERAWLTVSWGRVRTRQSVTNSSRR